MMHLMYECGWDLRLKSKPPYNETLLHHAARNGNAEVCQELINLGFDPNDQSSFGQASPLFSTIEFSIHNTEKNKQNAALKTAKTLIFNGSNPNLKNGIWGSPLLYIMGDNCYHPLLKLLLDSGADPNCFHDSWYDKTCLARSILCSSKDKMTIVKYLLQYGANPNQKGPKGSSTGVFELSGHNYEVTPIVLAIAKNEIETVKLLIEYGADLKTPVRKSQYGTIYPLDYAIKWNRGQIKDVLLQHGAVKGTW